MTPRETEPDLSVSVQESLVQVWIDSDLLWGQGHCRNSAGISPFEGGHNYLVGGSLLLIILRLLPGPYVFFS